VEKENEYPSGVTSTFAGVVSFIKTAFDMYKKKNRCWFNPFLSMEEILFIFRKGAAYVRIARCVVSL